MQIDQYKNSLIKYHAWTCLQGTNNTIFFCATTAPQNDKKFIFNDKLKASLNLPDNMNSFYDQKKESGAYERLWDFSIMSLCTDIEYFFKELFIRHYQDSSNKTTFFQKVNLVIEELNKKSLNFDKIIDDIYNINECFQIRHISTHNMGLVDEKFKDNVDTEYQVGERYIVNQEIYKKFFTSYSKLLTCIDEQIS